MTISMVVARRITIQLLPVRTRLMSSEPPSIPPRSHTDFATPYCLHARRARRHLGPLDGGHPFFPDLQGEAEADDGRRGLPVEAAESEWLERRVMLRCRIRSRLLAREGRAGLNARSPFRGAGDPLAALMPAESPESLHPGNAPLTRQAVHPAWKNCRLRRIA